MRMGRRPAGAAIGWTWHHVPVVTRRLQGRIGGILAAGRLGVLAADPTNTPAWFRPPEAAFVSEGKFVYERNCTVCHGRGGDGKGEMVQGMWPHPRKLSAGVFKYRTTPSGALPFDADLERTVRGGLYGS